MKEKIIFCDIFIKIRTCELNQYPYLSVEIFLKDFDRQTANFIQISKIKEVAVDEKISLFIAWVDYCNWAGGSGPLQNDRFSPLHFSTSLENNQLKEIAEKANLSAVTISRLVSLLEQNKNNNLTIHQLAEAFDISLRTSSRLLKQLHQSGLAKIVGEVQPPGRGRPRKIYNLLFPTT
ncbi:HTH domain-containing protein [Bacillus sp. FJAT-49705]|uniref:HTH domain-containing protein n=1 Tax=Cytobacillus citreus TaxID=2833586 RepID=A0ABS5NSI4_9BACI|nr:HTH domain-containing protein [Cytobacillus citreus]MBS4190787.1 HTH domain-containing protein [Cytobacillus citreus]